MAGETGRILGRHFKISRLSQVDVGPGDAVVKPGLSSAGEHLPSIGFGYTEMAGEGIFCLSLVVQAFWRCLLRVSIRSTRETSESWSADSLTSGFYVPITSRKSTRLKSESKVAILAISGYLHEAAIAASAGNSL
jgi:hypothetical protein